MINAYIIPDPDLTIKTDCFFLKPNSVTEGCKTATTSPSALVVGSIAAGIGWTLGGPFGAVMGVIGETALSCLGGTIHTTIKNCIESYHEV